MPLRCLRLFATNLSNILRELTSVDSANANYGGLHHNYGWKYFGVITSDERGRQRDAHYEKWIREQAPSQNALNANALHLLHTA